MQSRGTPKAERHIGPDTQKAAGFRLYLTSAAVMIRATVLVTQVGQIVDDIIVSAVFALSAKPHRHR